MYNNPYFNQQQRFQPMVGQQMPTQNYMQQPMQPLQSLNNQIGLLGKIVDSIDVVKSMDIPLDGSISYFPLADGTAIVCKQLQTDGTSKTIVYKPVESNKKSEEVQFLTFDDLENALNEYQDLRDMKNEIREIKKQLKYIKKPKEE